MRLLSSFIAVVPSLALAFPTIANNEYAKSIQWEKCKINDALPGECGKLMVPLDYTEPQSDKGLSLTILRVPATKSPKKGSIFLNFGGPGANGAADLAAFAPNILAATGGYHDLINVVPRGTNGTLTFSCFDDPVSRFLGGQATVGNASDVATGEQWARASLFTQTCAVSQNETGRYIGTAFVARDHMRVVDALGEDGMLRYWGFSYGTLLGSTIIALFPEKVDRVVLDGVVNPFEYYQNSETELMASTDDVFRGFCEGCVAARDVCPLARNLTATQLENALYAYFDEIRANPIPVADTDTPGGGYLVDYTTVKSVLLRQLNFPSTWPAASQMLAAKAYGGSVGLAALQDLDEALPGIKCSDVLEHTDDPADLRPVMEARRRLSRFGDAADHFLFRCAQWKLPAKERYDGDFDVETRNPVLIINNRFDPVTPLASARNVSQTFKGSVLLEQNSYGHISLAQGSLCTAKAVRAYFNEGKLPAAWTVCDDVKVPLFSGESGWAQVIKELNGNSTA